MDLTTPAYIAIVVLGVIVVVHSVVLFGLLHMLRENQTGSTRSPESGPMLGEVAPAFSGLDLSGHAVDSEDFADHKRVLLFLSPSCASCAATLADLRLMSAKGKGRVMAICSGTADECEALLGDYRSALRIVVDELNQVTSLYEVRSFPTAIVVNADNRLGSRGAPEQGMIDATAVDADVSAH